MSTKLEQQLVREQLKARLLMELTKHIGKGRAVGMGELFQAVFGKDWEHRINDTRQLRKLITELRHGAHPQPICSSCCSLAPGYFLASAGSELAEYVGKIKRAALKKLAIAAKLEKKPLPELLGQMALNMRENGGGDAV